MTTHLGFWGGTLVKGAVEVVEIQMVSKVFWF